MFLNRWLFFLWVISAAILVFLLRRRALETIPIADLNVIRVHDVHEYMWIPSQDVLVDADSVSVAAVIKIWIDHADTPPAYRIALSDGTALIRHAGDDVVLANIRDPVLRRDNPGVAADWSFESLRGIFGVLDAVWSLSDQPSLGGDSYVTESDLLREVHQREVLGRQTAPTGSDSTRVGGWVTTETLGAAIEEALRRKLLKEQKGDAEVGRALDLTEAGRVWHRQTSCEQEHTPVVEAIRLAEERAKGRESRMAENVFYAPVGTFVNRPVNTVLQDFQNAFMVEAGTRETDINQQLLDLVALVLGSAEISQADKDLATQALASVAKQVVDGEPSPLAVKGTLSEVTEIVSKAADVATPAAELIASVLKLFNTG
jgi:hypothetical protein